jgi:RNA polymerase sigma-70 factor (ECF subfamily)
MTGLSYNTMPNEEDYPAFVAAEGAVQDGPELLQIRDKALHLLEEPELTGMDEAKIESEKTNAEPRELVAELYTELRPQLYRYVAFTMGVGGDQTTEIIQETFVRLMAHLASGEEIKNPRGWAVRVARNLAVSYHRKNDLRWRSADEVEEELTRNQADPSLNQEQQFLQKERMRCIRKALLSFNPRHRAVFLMRMQGFRYQDIGDAMNINEQRAAEIVKLVAGRLAVVCG